MIEGRSLSEINNIVNNKLIQASNELAQFRSISVNDDFNEVIKDLSIRFKIDNLNEKVMCLFKES